VGQAAPSLRVMSMSGHDLAASTAENYRAFAAAARYLLGPPADITALRKLGRDRGDELAAAMRARRTQTNEPARCATLLPALALLPAAGLPW